MQYPIQTLHIISLHILCPNHQKYVDIRRGSLDYVFDYEKGEVNCQNEIVRNSYYWLRAMCMDEKRFGRKSKLQFCNCILLHVTLHLCMLYRAELGPFQSCHPFPDFKPTAHVRGNKKAWPKWVWPKWAWPENQVSMIFLSM